MKILIIEDEQLAADRLEKMLNKINKSHEILDKIGSVKESIRWLMNNEADLIFLDIQLSDGLSFSIFDQIAITTPIIFTTAYDQYAIKAFELNSVDYLLKPIRQQQLEESMQKFDAMKSAFGIDFENLLATFQGNKPEYKNRFLIRLGDKLKKVETEQIAYFFSMDKNVFFKTFSDKILPIEYSLDALEELLDPNQFFRINRQYLVNMEAIDKMEVWTRSRVKLELMPRVDDELDTIVSINRSADFKKWIDRQS